MKRRDFLKTGSLAALGGMLLTPFGAKANTIKEEFRGRKAKNIIFMVSDGMSVGTMITLRMNKERSRDGYADKQSSRVFKEKMEKVPTGWDFTKIILSKEH